MQQLTINGDIHFKISPEIKAILIELSEENDLTLSQFMVKMIKANLRRIGKL